MHLPSTLLPCLPICLTNFFSFFTHLASPLRAVIFLFFPILTLNPMCNHIISLVLIWYLSFPLFSTVPSSYAWHTVRPNKPKEKEVYWMRRCQLRGRETSVCLRSILLAGQGTVFLKAAVGMRVAGAMPFFSLVSGNVTGWYFRNLNHQPFSQSEVQCLCLARYPHPPPGWGSYRTTQKYVAGC